MNMNSVKIYNNEYEIAIRSLMIINKYENGIDIDSLIILDYLSLHSNVFDKELISLHPDNPFFGIELFSKRNLIKKSINLLLQKGLIHINYSDIGILYVASDAVNYFLSYFDGDYYNKLELNINEVIARFKNFSREELESYVYRNIELWKG